MVELDKIYNEDCLQGMKRIDTAAVDCIICDPPYLLENQGGGFWAKTEEPNVNAESEQEQDEDFFSFSEREQGRHKANHYNARGTRNGMNRLGNIKDGFDDEVLDEMCRVMKQVNIYLFCSQRQIKQYLDYFVGGRGCNWNLLTWHKTNPIPACGNKYLNDTEYIMFFREKGVKIYGSYETKRTFYTTLRNQEDNMRYKHPTVKPLQIVRNLVVNSTKVGGVVLDPFIGSGTTAVACAKEHRRYIGFEIDERHYRTAISRIRNEMAQLSLFE